MNAVELSKLSMDEELKLIERVFLAGPEKRRTIVFTGVDRQSGCTSIVTRAARRLASEAGTSVCMVDANVRRPALHASFDLDLAPGLIHALTSDAPIRTFLQEVPHKSVYMLAAGGAIADSRRLLSSDRLATRIAELQETFDYVLFDTPAIEEGPDATLVARHTQGAVLVIAANKTKRTNAQDATFLLDEAEIPIIGAILNQRQYPIPDQIYRWL
jgi:Mrp family chromosome partitioning ATPase